MDSKINIILLFRSAACHFRTIFNEMLVESSCEIIISGGHEAVKI